MSDPHTWIYIHRLGQWAIGNRDSGLARMVGGNRTGVTDNLYYRTYGDKPQIKKRGKRRVSGGPYKTYNRDIRYVPSKTYFR